MTFERFIEGHEPDQAPDAKPWRANVQQRKLTGLVAIYVGRGDDPLYHAAHMTADEAIEVARAILEAARRRQHSHHRVWL